MEKRRYLKDSPKLAEQLRQLQHEKKILRSVIYDYRAVERSKFARMRSAWCSFMDLFREGSARVVLPSQSEESDAATGESLTSSAEEEPDPYTRWMEIHAPNERDFDAMRAAIARFTHTPLISVIMPTYNTPEPYLRSAIDSVRGQIYTNWELCVADDNSSNRRHREILAEYAAVDSRIKIVYRPDNGHIAHASNSALDLASGEFVGFLDHDDVLAREALYEVANVVDRHPDADMIYSDEDKIGDDGRRSDPFFKPDWCPDSFLSRMYTCHFGVYRRSLVEAVGRLRPGL